MESAEQVAAAAKIIRLFLEDGAEVIEAPAEATVRFRTARTEFELGHLLRKLILDSINVTQFREVQTDLEEAFMSFARPAESGNASAIGANSNA